MWMGLIFESVKREGLGWWRYALERVPVRTHGVGCVWTLIEEVGCLLSTE